MPDYLTCTHIIYKAIVREVQLLAWPWDTIKQYDITEAWKKYCLYLRPAVLHYYVNINSVGSREAYVFLSQWTDTWLPKCINHTHSANISSVYLNEEEGYKKAMPRAEVMFKKYTWPTYMHSRTTNFARALYTHGRHSESTLALSLARTQIIRYFKEPMTEKMATLNKPRSVRGLVLLLDGAELHQ